VIIDHDPERLPAGLGQGVILGSATPIRPKSGATKPETFSLD